MQVKTLTCLGFVLAVICLMQVASGSQDCKVSELEKLSNEFCGYFRLKGLCKALLSHVRNTCSNCIDAGNNNNNSNITTTTPAA